MRQLFDDMLPIALKCGIGVWEYWDLTFGEIALTIEIHNENEKQRLQEVASFNYALANLVGLSVARLMDKNAKYPPIHEAFPSLFDDVPIAEAPTEDWRVTKERMARFAEAHNKKRGANNDS